MAKVFSIISCGIGTGKSFVTAVLADFLSGAMNKSVLVIDLGDYGSLTAILIGRDKQDEFCEESLAVRLNLDQLGQVTHPP